MPLHVKYSNTNKVARVAYCYCCYSFFCCCSFRRLWPCRADIVVVAGCRVKMRAHAHKSRARISAAACVYECVCVYRQLLVNGKSVDAVAGLSSACVCVDVCMCCVLTAYRLLHIRLDTGFSFIIIVVPCAAFVIVAAASAAAACAHTCQ